MTRTLYTALVSGDEVIVQKHLIARNKDNTDAELAACGYADTPEGAVELLASEVAGSRERANKMLARCDREEAAIAMWRAKEGR